MSISPDLCLLPMRSSWSFGSLLAVAKVFAQLTQDELAPLLSGLEDGLDHTQLLEKRVPLMTDDPTVAPLIDLQVWAPPVVPKHSLSCTVELLKHTFGEGSYNTPAIVSYTPPTDEACGVAGQWSAVSMNLTYDRLGVIWRTSSAEPTKTGTIWTTVKDVTHFLPLFAQAGDFMMDFSNIVDSGLLLDGAFDVIISATFYQGARSPHAADIIIPLSNLASNVANYFSIDSDAGATVNVTVPESATEAYVEIVCSGNSAEEFWYTNTPDEFLNAFPSETGLIGKGPFREVQVLVDGQLAGVVWPFAVIYTGGITPSNWRPLTSYGAYDAPTYWVDATPFIPLLVDQSKAHTITLLVRGQGSSPSINYNWWVSGSLHLRNSTSKTSGSILSYNVPDLNIKTTGLVSSGNETVTTNVVASRSLRIESEIVNGGKKKRVVFSQDLKYSNDARYVDEGWVQWVNQSTIGTSESKHSGQTVLRDAFDYPLRVASNYSLYTMQYGSYGSEIWQSYIRALQSPTEIYKSYLLKEHSKGEIGMDAWPGLRHAINGTGSNEQTFAYVDGSAGTYFRDIATKNDAYTKDRVWGSLKGANPPVPDNQIMPEGGPGFRKRETRTALRGCPN
ncbi:peptide N-acetyl-beta-D-glucosaminyl asparaginase amidase A-domain-containing protein [Flagelloscypha sp. PMI_526]|nr:peptide N-acetyl-beta-D-glucosaminyl asparaginase amidase A-domain-containing protein [Flagelloscypha sp. PMI_526]